MSLQNMAIDNDDVKRVTQELVDAGPIEEDAAEVYTLREIIGIGEQATAFLTGNSQEEVTELYEQAREDIKNSGPLMDTVTKYLSQRINVDLSVKD